MTIRVGLACAGDLSAVVSLDQLVWGEGAWTRADYLAHLRQGSFQLRVARDELVPPGEFPLGASILSHQLPGPTLVLDRFLVHPHHRQTGLATSLLRHHLLLAHQRKFRSVRIHVPDRSDWLPMHRFLARHGFHGVIDRNHYQEGNSICFSLLVPHPKTPGEYPETISRPEE